MKDKFGFPPNGDLDNESRLLDFTAFYISRSIRLPILSRKFSSNKEKEKLNFPEYLKIEFGNKIKRLHVDHLLGEKTQFSKLIRERNEVLTDFFLSWVEEYAPKNQFSPRGVESVYNEYNKLHKICPSVFISYYYMRIKSLRNQSGHELLKTRRELESFFAKKGFIDNKLWYNIENQKRNSLEVELTSAIEGADFQLVGFLDQKGVFIDERKTLVNTLDWLSRLNFHKLEYPIVPRDHELQGLQLLKLKIFDYYSKNFKSKIHPSNLSSEELLLYEELQRLKQNEWREIIGYLIEVRKMTPEEIDYLINTLYGGKFNSLEIRSIEITTDVQIFHLWHLFYLFEYQKESTENNLEKIKDFQVILNLQAKMNKEDNEKPKQIRKYYLRKQNGFTTIEATISEVEEKLQIERGKLNSVPNL